MLLYVCTSINGWELNRTGNLLGQADVEIPDDDDILQVTVESGCLGDYVSHCKMTGNFESIRLRMRERNAYRGRWAILRTGLGSRIYPEGDSMRRISISGL